MPLSGLETKRHRDTLSWRMHLGINFNFMCMPEISGKYASKDTREENFTIV